MTDFLPTCIPPLGHETGGQGHLETIHDLTALGNAERLIDQNRGRFFWVEALKSWLEFSGGKFKRSNAGAMQFCQKVVQGLFELAKSNGVFRTDHGELVTAEQVFDFAKSSSKLGALKAMLVLASSNPEVMAQVEDFDADPFLLNCPNLVVNLKTGETQPNDPSLKMTKMAGALYLPDAQCERWLQFLDQVTARSKQMAEFLQRLSGYLLTGSTREQALYILFGPGSNGKSTFVDMLLEAAGSYGRASNSGMLQIGSRPSIRSDIARLRGARMVSAVEMNHEGRLNEAMIKQLTGGDRITERELYANEIEFTPQFKLVITANRLPAILGTDDGIWRRIVVVPFRVKFPKDKLDKDLKAQLKEELPGILAWMAQGAIKYLSEGLQYPPEVEKAIDQYKANMDQLGDFLLDCYENDPQGNSSIPVPVVYDAYRSWCERNGEEPMKKQALNQALSGRGYTRSKSGGSRTWKGLRPKLS